MPETKLAFGFWDLQSVLDREITTVGLSRVRDAVNASFEEHNRQMEALLSRIVSRTTDAQLKFELSMKKTLQPLDDHGNPLPTQGHAEYEVAWPILGGGDAYGLTWLARQMTRVADMNDFVTGVQDADADWIIRHILAAVLNNNSWTFEDPKYGNLTVKPLANGDSDEYVKRNGERSTADHYKAQANSIGDNDNPFPTVRKTLRPWIGNEGPIVAYVAEDLRDDIEGLAVFKDLPDPVIDRADNVDQLNGRIDPAFGDELVGYISGSRVWIVEWSRMPSGYMFCEPLEPAAPALAMREFPQESAQGLNQEVVIVNEQIEKVNARRFAGFGAWNRIAAMVMQIGNAIYQVPAKYQDQPLPV